MSFDKDIEEDIKKEKALNKDPLEKIKQKLRDNQETVYADPDKIYVELKIPKTGKVGGECKVKFSKKVPLAQITISEQLEWKRSDKYNPRSKMRLVNKPFNIISKKDCDYISIKFEDIGYVRGKQTNMLREGEYLIEARGYSIQAYEDTTAKRLVKVS